MEYLVKHFRYCLRECSGECVEKYLAGNASVVLLGVPQGMSQQNENAIVFALGKISRNIKWNSSGNVSESALENTWRNVYRGIVLGILLRMSQGMFRGLPWGLLQGMLHILLNFWQLSLLLFWETSWSINKKRKVGKPS